MRKIVLDTNCLLMSLPRISPYRKIWDDFLKGKLTLCVTNEIIEEYLEIIEQKTNANIASNVVNVLDIVADFSNTVAMFRVKPNSHD